VPRWLAAEATGTTIYIRYAGLVQFRRPRAPDFPFLAV